eukprot:Blabericola_migrator_1__49@NODE_1010_length_5714_cov_79_058438_g693_i0_p8_GENE_NODE_1010_length_5714_cov_79_058438_g693_i0NODE_1010_length_5714_cov_79_058438_g693_i0_p8_ORF_typecomplete_len108_score7_08_NODE_1010_length_5714_cov_79_058438_g693_i052575580
MESSLANRRNPSMTSSHRISFDVLWLLAFAFARRACAEHARVPTHIESLCLRAFLAHTLAHVPSFSQACLVLCGAYLLHYFHVSLCGNGLKQASIVLWSHSSKHTVS